MERKMVNRDSDDNRDNSGDRDSETTQTITVASNPH